jgi:B9 domain-containing protein 2
MPEVHIIGEIEGATGFPSTSLFCKFKVIADQRNWEALEGFLEGQTQVDFPKVIAAQKKNRERDCTC